MNVIWNNLFEMAWKTTSHIKVQTLHLITHKFSHNSVFKMKLEDWDKMVNKWDEKTHKMFLQEEFCNMSWWNHHFLVIAASENTQSLHSFQFFLPDLVTDNINQAKQSYREGRIPCGETAAVFVFLL